MGEAKATLICSVNDPRLIMRAVVNLFQSPTESTRTALEKLAKLTPIETNAPTDAGSKSLSFNDSESRKFETSIDFPEMGLGLEMIDHPGHDTFYARLYLALFEETRGFDTKARMYMQAATESKYAHDSRDYMVAVARVHQKLRGWLQENNR